MDGATGWVGGELPPREDQQPSINLMKNTQLLAALLTLSLAPASVEAQSFQARRAGGNFQAAGRVDPVIKVDFNLAARQHQFLESGDNTGVRVREVSGPQKEGSFFAPRVGLPDLGMRLTKVLLPYEAAAEDMKLEILSEELVDIGVFDLAPAADAKESAVIVSL